MKRVKDQLCHYVVAAELSEAPRPRGEAAPEHHRLEFQLQALGYLMIETAAQGDCGIDALCFWDLGCTLGTERHWRSLRQELARFMEDNQTSPIWQELFQSCQEDDERLLLERTSLAEEGDGSEPELVEDPASPGESEDSEEDEAAALEMLTGGAGFELRTLRKTLGETVWTSGAAAKAAVVRGGAGGGRGQMPRLARPRWRDRQLRAT